VRVPQLATVRRRLRRNDWPEAMLYAGTILVVATITAALVDAPMRQIVVLLGIAAAGVCMWLARPGKAAL
jgi:hypothetical protein